MLNHPQVYCFLQVVLSNTRCIKYILSVASLFSSLQSIDQPVRIVVYVKVNTSSVKLQHTQAAACIWVWRSHAILYSMVLAVHVNMCP